MPGSYPHLSSFLTHSSAAYHAELPAKEIRAALLTWYADNRRRLPWRGDAPPYNGSTAATAKAAQASAAAAAAVDQPAAPVSAYGTWVSEIMLQQTRVEAVIPYWLAWMEAFPTVDALAAASEEQVNAKWAGLGFYRRARMLHEGARQVVNEHNGVLPCTVEGLLQIKGIGPYTAGAVASISAGVAAPIVDGNVLRVLSRVGAIAAHPKESAFAADGKLAWQLARVLVEADDGREPGAFNQALMELGATHCAPSGTGIDEEDPLAALYRSTAIGRDAYRAHKAGELTPMLDAAAADARGDGGGSSKRGTTKPSGGGSRTGLHLCPACAAGAAAAIHGLRGVTDATDEAAAATLVHALLPLPVPKKARREERLALAVLYRVDGGVAASNAGEKGKGTAPTSTDGQQRSWLLVKRPEGGLLAGQWEFPHAIVASDKQALPDDPGTQARSAATMSVLAAAGESVGDLPGGELADLDEPLEHIFSHVRHTMHVAHARAEPPQGAARVTAGEEEWTRDGRTYCWMSAARMGDVGVTAGVLKVIAAVESATGGAKAKAKAKRPSAAKAEADKKQPKLSTFFTPKS